MNKRSLTFSVSSGGPGSGSRFDNEVGPLRCAVRGHRPRSRRNVRRGTHRTRGPSCRSTALGAIRPRSLPVPRLHRQRRPPEPGRVGPPTRGHRPWPVRTAATPCLAHRGRRLSGTRARSCRSFRRAASLWSSPTRSPADPRWKHKHVPSFSCKKQQHEQKSNRLVLGCSQPYRMWGEWDEEELTIRSTDHNSLATHVRALGAGLYSGWPGRALTSFRRPEPQLPRGASCANVHPAVSIADVSQRCAPGRLTCTKCRPISHTEYAAGSIGSSLAVGGR